MMATVAPRMYSHEDRYCNTASSGQRVRTHSGNTDISTLVWVVQTKVLDISTQVGMEDIAVIFYFRN